MQWILEGSNCEKDKFTIEIERLLQPIGYLASNELQSESLLLSLDALISFIKHSKTEKLTGEIIHFSIQCALKLWKNYSQDSYINSYILDILQVIVAHPTEEILNVACTQSVPLIEQVFKTPELEAEKVTAIELLEIFIKASSKFPSSVNETGSILSNLIQACFPSLMNLLLQIRLEADLILTTGTKCLFSIFQYGLHHQSGNIPGQEQHGTALQINQVQQLLPSLLQYISKLLAPESSDMICMEIGCLINIILMDCSSFFQSSPENFFILLQKLIIRLQCANMFDVQQSLICSIGRILCMNVKNVIEFLISNNFFEFLIQFWIREYQQFCDEYTGKLSILSFGHLLLDSSSQQLLNNLNISIQKQQNSSKRVTRSSSKNISSSDNDDSVKSISVCNRLLEYLFGELLQCSENIYDHGASDQDFDDDDDHFDSDDGSYDDDNEWDPLNDEINDNFYGIDDLLDQPDEEDDSLSSILLKLDSFTTPRLEVGFFLNVFV